jgi:beta-lactamase superfamily II metal-dependent hydrolase
MEVVVFGPGTGEAILVHCTGNEWLCVDCTTDEGRCWPLWYLAQLGAQASSCVRMIVATHWHSDHVKGLSRLIEECGNTQFVCSGALRSDEFQQIVARFSTEEVGAVRPPLSEVRRCFDIIASRKGRSGYKAPKFASSDRTLDRFLIGSRAVEVTALSPSDQDQLNALEAFAEYFVPVDEPAAGPSPIDQNHASVVVVIRVDDEFVLLGADLERTASPHTGWNALVASTTRPQFLATPFKVPHHGSSNGQSNDVWAKMLAPSAGAVVTPFLSSRLPRPEGLQWLLQRTSDVYATGIPTGANVRRRPEVDRTIKETSVNFESLRIPQEPGIVRFRKVAGSKAPWNVETFGEAKKL